MKYVQCLTIAIEMLILVVTGCGANHSNFEVRSMAGGSATSSQPRADTVVEVTELTTALRRPNAARIPFEFNSLTEEAKGKILSSSCGCTSIFVGNQLIASGDSFLLSPKGPKTIELVVNDLDGTSVTEVAVDVRIAGEQSSLRGRVIAFPHLELIPNAAILPLVKHKTESGFHQVGISATTHWTGKQHLAVRPKVRSADLLEPVLVSPSKQRKQYAGGVWEQEWDLQMLFRPQLPSTIVAQVDAEDHQGVRVDSRSFVVRFHDPLTD